MSDKIKMKTEKKEFYKPSADLNKLIELSNGGFRNKREAKDFFKAISIATLIVWQMSDEEQAEDRNTDILIDGLTALTYVQI